MQVLVVVVSTAKEGETEAAPLRRLHKRVGCMTRLEFIRGHWDVTARRSVDGIRYGAFSAEA